MLGYIAALLAAVAYGLATLLEASAARRSAASTALDLRLVGRLLRQWVFVASVAVSLAGVLASVIALRRLPLFVVQAIVAASVAVSVVGAAWRYGEALHRRALVGLGAIVVGLVLLAVSSGPEAPPETSSAFRWTLFAFAVGALGLAALAARRPTTSSLDVGLLGATSGVLYGVGNVGLRVVPGFAPSQLVTDPAAWAAVVGGIGGLVALATALQRGSVAIAAGAVTVAETLVPAAIGLLVLGERPRQGFTVVAVIGFVAAVAGAVALCREEELDLDIERGGPADPSRPSGPPLPGTGVPPVTPH